MLDLELPVLQTRTMPGLPAPEAPPVLDAIEHDTRAIGFPLASDRATGALLRALAASKPAGRLLEVGTGTGVATAWLLDGMDAHATLLSVDTDGAVQSIARRHLGDDTRAQFVLEDGGAWLTRHALTTERFDLIFADAWPGKYSHLEPALSLLAPGGLYVIDDMLPQPNWPADHAPRVTALLDALRLRSDLAVSPLDWSTGVLVATRR